MPSITICLTPMISSTVSAAGAVILTPDPKHLRMSFIFMVPLESAPPTAPITSDRIITGIARELSPLTNSPANVYRNTKTSAPMNQNTPLRILLSLRTSGSE